MIDFLRLYYRDKSKLENFVLEEGNFDTVNTVMEYHTGEIKYPFTTKLGSMDIGVSEKSAYVKNSIHKLHNFRECSVELNYDDFTYSEICNEVDYLCKNIINAESARLTQLEFGLNVETKMLPEILVRRNFYMHNYKEGSRNNYGGKGELKQFTHGNYCIKVYDKGKQFELEKNILRFEMKFIKAREFKKFGVFNIQDLKNKQKLRILFKNLIKRFDEMTIVDDFDAGSIKSIDDYNDLQKYTNPIYWTEEIKGIHQQKRKREIQKFQKLLIKNDLLKTKVYLRSLLIQKFIYLINF